MSTSEKKRCSSCGAENPPGAAKCLSCDHDFEDRRSVEEDVDKLLSDIFGDEGLGSFELDDDYEEDELSLEDSDGLEDELGLDLKDRDVLAADKTVKKELRQVAEPEVVDESLLESLLIETQWDDDEEEIFECPLCGAHVSVEATICPGCGAPFADDEVASDEGDELDSLVDELLDETPQPPAKPVEKKPEKQVEAPKQLGKKPPVVPVTEVPKSKKIVEKPPSMQARKPQTHAAFEKAEPEAVKARAPPRLEKGCLLYTSPSPRDRTRSRMPSSA